MRPIEFLKEKSLLIIVHIVCMFLLTSFLVLTGYSADYCAIILICWFILLNIWIICQFISRNRYFQKLEEIEENLEQRYLLGELMPNSFHLEDKLYRELIWKSNKDVIERIRQIEHEQEEYREYIESWVHEIKAPITAIALKCENNQDERSRYILIENQKVENYVDMALYYARSDAVYKDYIIRKTDLQQMAEKVLMKNKHYLIQNHVRAFVDCPNPVFTDEKWVSFILNQLIQNSTKYRREYDAQISITTEKRDKSVLLKIKDNGIGISEKELSRIFEKGFTGTNGRKIEHSTGMGLYLTKKLCEKLGIYIEAVSEIEKGTEIILGFPVSSYLSDYRT